MKRAPATHSRATAALKRRLGPRIVRTDERARFRASFDSSKVAFPVEAVVRPRKESDIGIALQLANKHRVPLTVRGGGTSLTGSASPLRGGWVLDLSALRRVQIDAEAGLAIVGSGAIVGDIQRAAAAAGWFYPPDPSSKEYSTIGGYGKSSFDYMHDSTPFK
jgi:glycolate oxidase